LLFCQKSKIPAKLKDLREDEDLLNCARKHEILSCNITQTKQDKALGHKKTDRNRSILYQ
jgi:hypothetical protein